MEANEQKKCDIKKIITVVLFFISVLVIFIGWWFQKCDNKVLGYLIALFCSLIIGGVILRILIKYSIAKKDSCYGARLSISFVANLFFLGIPMMFVFIDAKSLSESLVLILTLVIYLLTFILLSIFIKIKREDDISLLKATNYLIVFIFTAINHLKGDSFLILHYVLLPLILAQALYEIFGSKRKQFQEEKK